jgi:ATP-dependent Clp protease ATP-binding subunit ClpC
MVVKLPGEFLYWWLVKAPKRIFVTGKRFLILLNNTISFTLNVRLLFTPLFGDFTLIGRFIGFNIRIFQIVFGLIFMLTVSSAVLLLPILWLTAPLILFKFIKFWTLFIYLEMYLCWVIITKNTPRKKVSEVMEKDPSDYLNSFRPVSKNLYELLNRNFPVGVKTLMERQEIKYVLLMDELERENLSEKLFGSPKFDTTKIGIEAYKIALKHKTRFVEPEHVFFAFISNVQKPETLLATFETTLEELEKTVEWVVSEHEHLSKIYLWQEDCEMLFVGGIGKGMTGRVTPLLDSISEDYTRKVQSRRIEKIVDRETEIKKIADLLTGTRENILIIGNPGSGKTAIVRGMAYKIIEGTEYSSLKNRRIVSLDIGALIAGAKTAGDISAKLNLALEEIKGSGDIILFIDEIHNLVASAGDKNAETSTIYTILEPHIVSDRIQFIGATSIPNYRKFIEPNGAFARLFNIIEIKETSKEDTMEILKARSRKAKRKYGITVTYPALVKTIELCNKLIHERVMPDKALDVLNRAVSNFSQSRGTVDSTCIAREVSEMTNIPSEIITQSEAQKVLNIEEAMQKMVVGQNHAIKQIGSALKRARAGVRNDNKPIASFLFVGTTGVGKTQTAKALAKSYFGDQKTMIRIDMSEYQQADSINRLIGNPDASSKGLLTESVRTNPSSLILLDEIEKAHPNILLIFLQVLDDGRLTDSSGTVVSFNNSIIIATSNVGTRSIQQIFEEGGTIDEMDAIAKKEIREKFAPEFLNRFTGIIMFNPLTMDSVRQICLMLLETIKDIAKEKGFKLTFTPELVDELIKRGYNPEWGARPLARVIEDTVESYIATKILKNEIKPGDEISLGTAIFVESTT